MEKLPNLEVEELEMMKVFWSLNEAVTAKEFALECNYE